jgi:hypothetical protein
MGPVRYTEEVVTLNGQTEVNTVKTYDAHRDHDRFDGGFWRGECWYYLRGHWDGHIRCTSRSVQRDWGRGQHVSGGPLDLPDRIYGYLVKGKITTGTTTASQYIVGKLKLRDVDGVVRTAAIVTLADGAAWYDFDYPIRITAGQCVTATATGRGNNNDVSCYLQIVLIQERGPL